MNQVRFEAVRAAAQRIAGRVLVTPTLPSPGLSAELNAQVFLKYESLQLTGPSRCGVPSTTS